MIVVNSQNDDDYVLLDISIYSEPCSIDRIHTVIQKADIARH